MDNKSKKDNKLLEKQMREKAEYQKLWTQLEFRNFIYKIFDNGFCNYYGPSTIKIGDDDVNAYYSAQRDLSVLIGNILSEHIDDFWIDLEVIRKAEKIKQKFGGQ